MALCDFFVRSYGNGSLLDVINLNSGSGRINILGSSLLSLCYDNDL
jgi:hypothetical protein